MISAVPRDREPQAVSGSQFLEEHNDGGCRGGGFAFPLPSVYQGRAALTPNGQSCKPEKISGQKLFHDVRRELIAWAVLVPLLATVEFLLPAFTVSELRRRLSTLLGSAWTPRWVKTPPTSDASRPNRYRELEPTRRRTDS